MQQQQQHSQNAATSVDGIVNGVAQGYMGDASGQGMPRAGRRVCSFSIDRALEL
jgi:hypothetical protein